MTTLLTTEAYDRLIVGEMIATCIDNGIPYTVEEIFEEFDEAIDECGYYEPRFVQYVWKNDVMMLECDAERINTMMEEFDELPRVIQEAIELNF